MKHTTGRRWGMLLCTVMLVTAANAESVQDRRRKHLAKMRAEKRRRDKEWAEKQRRVPRRPPHRSPSSPSAEKPSSQQKPMTWDEEWLQANAKHKDVTVLPSGLQYKVLRAGTGVVPLLDCHVDVHAKGFLISDGSEFENTFKARRPKKNLPVFKLIKGWSEALTMMAEGSSWEIFLPSELAYGQKRVGRFIRPGMALRYQIDLLKVTPPSPLKMLRKSLPWAQARANGNGLLHVPEADLDLFRKRVPTFLALYHQAAVTSAPAVVRAQTFIRTAELVLDRPDLPRMVAVLSRRTLPGIRLFTVGAGPQGERFKGPTAPEGILMFLQNQAMGLLSSPRGESSSPRGGSSAKDMFNKHVTALWDRDFDAFEQAHPKLLLLVHSNALHPVIKRTFARAAAKIKYLAQVFAVDIEDSDLCARLRIRCGVSAPLLYLRLPQKKTIQIKVDLSNPKSFSDRRLLDSLFLHVSDSKEL